MGSGGWTQDSLLGRQGLYKLSCLPALVWLLLFCSWSWNQPLLSVPSFRVPCLWDAAAIGFVVHSDGRGPSNQKSLSHPSLGSHIALFSPHLAFHCHHQSLLCFICHPELSWLWDPGVSGLSTCWLRCRPGWDPRGGAGEHMLLREITEMLLQQLMALFLLLLQLCLLV